MTGYSKCLIFLFDGARFDVFNKLLEAGKLPNIERHVVSKGSFLRGYSCIPTTTGPAHIPFLYGIFPGTANVPGIRWFDKTNARINTGADSHIRSYVGPGCLFMGSDISKDAVPLYSYFSRPLNLFGSLDLDYNVKIKSNRLQKAFYYLFAHLTKQWEVVDKRSARSIKRHIERGNDFIFSLFPAIDKITHLYHPVHENVLRQYYKLDESVGEIFVNLSNGEISKILVFIVSDHGLSKTHTHISLVNLLKEEGYKPMYYPRIFRRDYNVAIMESGNAIASIYFLEPVNNRPAFFEELTTSDKNIRFINRILSHEGIDFIGYRVNDHSLGVKNRHGEIVLEFIENSHVKFTNTGENPLGFGVNEDVLPLDESLEFTINTNYPDSIVQLRQLLSSNRTGDLVVFAKNGFDLRKKYEWPEHKSSHGSLIKSHMEVPICANIKLKSTLCRVVDVFPTILSKMGYNIPGNIDGKTIQ